MQRNEKSEIYEEMISFLVLLILGRILLAMRQLLEGILRAVFACICITCKFYKDKVRIECNYRGSC